MERFTKLFGSLTVFVYHCFDRVVIHGHLSGLSRPEQVVYFFRQVLGIPVVSKGVLSQRTDDYRGSVEYRGWVEAYARNHIPALPFCHAELRATKPRPPQYPKQINSLGDHIRTRRLDLKLLQKEVADHIGVDKITITNWEGNTSVPAIRYIPAILCFLGYDPFPRAQTLADRLATVRKMLGLSQRMVAESLGVDPGTIQSWETGQHEPIGRNVELIERFLRTSGNPRRPFS